MDLDKLVEKTKQDIEVYDTPADYLADRLSFLLDDSTRTGITISAVIGGIATITATVGLIYLFFQYRKLTRLITMAYTVNHVAATNLGHIKPTPDLPHIIYVESHGAETSYLSTVALLLVTIMTAIQLMRMVGKLGYQISKKMKGVPLLWNKTLK